MEVKLVLENGAEKSQTFLLRAPVTILGRRKGCDLRIPAHSVSRQHCRLTMRDDFLTVEDLASVNGTFVNDQPVSGPTVVHPGDRLKVGTLTFLVQYQLTPRAIKILLEEHQRQDEILPTFDVNSSSLPVPIKEGPPPAKKKRQTKKQSAAAAKKTKSKDQPWPRQTGQESKDIRDILSQLEDE